ncbi:MAG: FG-GAP repeat protein [Planctomycetes bacterium]|nr:FG-GAP repeat protein [Planctomycetota bacterium]
MFRVRTRASSFVALGAFVLATPTATAQLQADPLVELTAADGAAGANFGQALDLDGERLAVGAPEAGGVVARSGAVYVFVRTTTGWSQEAKLVAPDGTSGARFGSALDLDGARLVIGAPDDGSAAAGAGSAYVFARAGSAWTLEVKLVAREALPHAAFGFDVALQADRLAVSALRGGAESGEIELFTRAASAWTPSARLVPSDAAVGDEFGCSVALRDDVLVAGARSDDDRGAETGSAYVFRDVGGAWVQEAKLYDPSVVPVRHFGQDVAFDGRRLVAGCDACIATYRHDAGGWRLEALVGDGPLPYATGGFRVDGDVLAIGAWMESGTGRVHVYGFDGSAWSETLVLAAPDAAPGDVFGMAFGLAARTLVVAARDDDEVGLDAGAAWSFDLWGTRAYGRAASGAHQAALAAVSPPIAGDVLRFVASGFTGARPCYLFAGRAAVEVPFGSGTLLVAPERRALLGTVPLVGGAGVLDVVLAAPPGATFFVQGLQRDGRIPGGVVVTNGVEVRVRL